MAIYGRGTHARRSQILTHPNMLYDPEKRRVVYQPVSIEPRILVPKVIRHDNRYDPALTNAPINDANANG